MIGLFCAVLVWNDHVEDLFLQADFIGKILCDVLGSMKVPEQLYTNCTRLLQ